jgi:hypothetical protein
VEVGGLIPALERAIGSEIVQQVATLQHCRTSIGLEVDPLKAGEPKEVLQVHHQSLAQTAVLAVVVVIVVIIVLFVLVFVSVVVVVLFSVFVVVFVLS